MLQFLNTPDDCQWLRETHLRALPQVHRFASFVMAGNEDAPGSVDLYVSADPEVTDTCARILFGADGTGGATFAILPNFKA